MAGGRPRKPTHLKIVSGTAQKCRINPSEPVGTAGAPLAPELLSERAAAIFYETCATMDSMGTLSVEWRDAIADYARCQEEVEELSAIIEDLGRTYMQTTVSGDTIPKARPEVAMRSDAMRRAQMLRAELGVGPASKARVSATKKQSANPFEALKA